MKYTLDRFSFLENVTQNEILFIVDVQKSYAEFFTDNYVKQLQNYCKTYSRVYQIWDNHIDGDVSNNNYATNPNPKIPIDFDLYKMPNTKTYIEKRYFYLEDVKLLDFFNDRISDEVKEELEKKESFVKGDFFKTKEGTTVIFVDNNHVWFEIPIKLERIVNDIVDLNQTVTLVGGADGECLLDIITAFEHLGLKYSLDHSYIYGATHCPR